MSLQTLIDTAQKHSVKVNRETLKKAYDFAKTAHHGQFRHTGQPFFTHPVQVAIILASWGQSPEVLEAALLHDTVEDTATTQEMIQKEFGDQIAFLVSGVTKIGQVKLRASHDEFFVENLRKMFVAMAADLRVVLIRLADRLHNMRTLDAIPRLKQKRIATETLEVYAPLAERLGMGQLKGELEDLSFPYAHPEDFARMNQLADRHLKEARATTRRSVRALRAAISQTLPHARVHGRPKHLYSLYQKLLRPSINRDITKIHDLVALRVITQTIPDCYAALGIVHSLWKPVPHIGISDFIAQPKPNGYQSIHTKVFDHQGHILEVQIRTVDQHRDAEFGAAAHYAYAEAKKRGASEHSLDQGTAFTVTQKMDWVKQLAAWQHEVADSKEFVRDLKLDALSPRIYVFSPKGDVFDLPALATPIDFAYAVHTDLVNFISAAKVNDRLVTLDHPLASGDVVQIIKSKQKRPPSRHWLEFVKTRRARARIRTQLKK